MKSRWCSAIHWAVPAAALTACIGLAAPGARADLPPDSKATLQQRLDALGKHFHGGSLARWSIPDDKAALEKIWDVPAVLGTPPYAAKDASTLIQILKGEAEILKLYTNAGEAPPNSPKEARVRVKYQDEIVRGSAFLASTSAALLEAMGDVAGRFKPEQLSQDRRQGMEHGRLGVRNLIESFNAELRLPGVSAENKMLLLDALAANAPTIAAYSPAQDRKSYADAAKATLPNLSDAEKAKLQVFISEMDTKECKGLCALKG